MNAYITPDILIALASAVFSALQFIVQIYILTEPRTLRFWMNRAIDVATVTMSFLLVNVWYPVSVDIVTSAFSIPDEINRIEYAAMLTACISVMWTVLWMQFINWIRTRLDHKKG